MQTAHGGGGGGGGGSLGSEVGKTCGGGVYGVAVGDNGDAPSLQAAEPAAAEGILSAVEEVGEKGPAAAAAMLEGQLRLGTRSVNRLGD